MIHLANDAFFSPILRAIVWRRIIFSSLNPPTFFQSQPTKSECLGFYLLPVYAAESPHQNLHKKLCFHCEDWNGWRGAATQTLFLELISNGLNFFLLSLWSIFKGKSHLRHVSLAGYDGIFLSSAYITQSTDWTYEEFHIAKQIVNKESRCESIVFSMGRSKMWVRWHIEKKSH